MVMNLIKEVPEAQDAKHQVDRLIEAIGPPHGVEHVREAIVMDKMQYDVASDEYRDILKERIMDQVEKYFMMIVFSMYCKKVKLKMFHKQIKSVCNFRRVQTGSVKPLANGWIVPTTET